MSSPVDSSSSETTGGTEQKPAAEGLLDLSIELSSPQVFSGSKFALYLHVKNPFSQPIWIRKVTTHLPSAVHAVEAEGNRAEPVSGGQNRDPAADAYVETLLGRLTAIQRRLDALAGTPRSPETDAETERLAEQARETRTDLALANELIAVRNGHDAIAVRGSNSFADVQHGSARPIFVSASGADSSIRFAGGKRSSETVSLHGALPADVALQPGGHNVWTLTLATNKNLFFLPAAYRFNVTVLYSFDPPGEDGEAAHSSTAPTTVNIRASLWSVMAGSVTGGILGTIARILQDAREFPALFTFPTIGPILLSVTLSIAASIFAARKSETQSFVSVEDFWGGALIGFLIGYSGTAAFENFTRVQAEQAVPSPA